VLARARTGSGKTGAYAIPAIQKVLEAKEVRYSSSSWAMLWKLILGCRPYFGSVSEHQGCHSCSYEGTCNAGPWIHQDFNYVLRRGHYDRQRRVRRIICIQVSYAPRLGLMLTIRSLRSEAPDVIISTPTKLLALLEAKTINLSNLCFLAVDEAIIRTQRGSHSIDGSCQWMDAKARCSRLFDECHA
jgi:ATP-dependent RNA helicase DDX56/DBP9